MIKNGNIICNRVENTLINNEIGEVLVNEPDIIVLERIFRDCLTWKIKHMMKNIHEVYKEGNISYNNKTPVTKLRHQENTRLQLKW